MQLAVDLHGEILCLTNNSTSINLEQMQQVDKKWLKLTKCIQTSGERQAKICLKWPKMVMSSNIGKSGENQW